MITEAQVAETVAGTLNWAANQASNPLFKNIVGLDIGEINLTVDLPGPVARFRLVVERIPPCGEDHDWQTDKSGLIDTCQTCGEERA